jgi:hypothetical protein
MGVSEGVKAAVKAVNDGMNLPADQRRDYYEMLGHAATKYMRAIGGDDYIRGYLEAALAELDHPPIVELVKMQ